MSAGVPLFVDRPLALTVGDLKEFMEWKRRGARAAFLEFLPIRSGARFGPKGNARVGQTALVSGVMGRDWENYAIHALEPICCALVPLIAGLVSRSESDRRVELSEIIASLG